MILLVSPEIIRPPPNLAVDEGDSILMECVARGFPIPKIHWYQNNQRTPYNGSVIQIPAVSSQHTGIYRCVAENVAGNDSATAVLAVRGEYSAICFQAFQKKMSLKQIRKYLRDCLLFVLLSHKKLHS